MCTSIICHPFVPADDINRNVHRGGLRERESRPDRRRGLHRVDVTGVRRLGHELAKCGVGSAGHGRHYELDASPLVT